MRLSLLLLTQLRLSFVPYSCFTQNALFQAVSHSITLNNLLLTMLYIYRWIFEWVQSWCFSHFAGTFRRINNLIIAVYITIIDVSNCLYYIYLSCSSFLSIYLVIHLFFHVWIHLYYHRSSWCWISINILKPLNY